MDETEKIVEIFLYSQGYNNIKYEPDGNVPPDFSIDGKIAIEVRRLNQNYFGNLKPQGLEETEIPLWQRMKKLLACFGPARSGETWYVSIWFGRPMMPWQMLKPKLCMVLEKFLLNPRRCNGTIFDEVGFKLDVFRASKSHPQLLIMASSSDSECGGFILGEMEKNIQYCADEKSQKILRYRPKYPVWWLALVDYIGHGLDDFDLEMFYEQSAVQHTWDKIIIISPRDPKRHFII